jgi:hypothetical protein
LSFFSASSKQFQKETIILTESGDCPGSLVRPSPFASYPCDYEKERGKDRYVVDSTLLARITILTSWNRDYEVFAAGTSVLTEIYLPKSGGSGECIMKSNIATSPTHHSGLRFQILEGSKGVMGEILKS